MSTSDLHPGTGKQPRSRTAELEPTMLSYRKSWSSTGQQFARDIRKPLNRLRNRRKNRPVDSSIRETEHNDGASAARPRGSPVSCSVDDILNADEPKVESRLEYPQFDSLEAYCISDHKATSEKVWREEAERLHYYVKKPDIPVRFDNREYFMTGDENGYKRLSNLAEKILTAVSLCVLDNECINVRCCTQLSNRKSLQKLIQQAQVAAQDNHSKNNSIDSQEKTALFDLVNYISIVLARLITQTGAGGYWHATVLSALVKRVAKIKILLLDLPSNAYTAAQHGEDVLDRSRDRGSVKATIVDEEEECEEVLRIIDADTKDGLTSLDEAKVASYCVSQNKFRSGMSSALRSIVMSLRCLNVSGLSTTSFEICGLVYETGFEGFKVFIMLSSFSMPCHHRNVSSTLLAIQTLLYQNRNLEYSATSDLDNLNTADSAFNILNQTIEHLNRLRGYSRNARAIIDWTYNVSDQMSSNNRQEVSNPTGGVSRPNFHGKSLALEFMDDIITIMVPLATTSPELVSKLNSFRGMMLLASDNQALVLPYKETNFTAFFRLCTKGFEEDTRPNDILRLKAAFENGSFERGRLIDPSVGDSILYSPKSVRKFRERTKLMDREWIIDETSIIVPGHFYVWSMTILAITLAAGGLAIGFTLGNRITGVDPFNIATYAWVLAAFVILICKSVLVKEWTWSDFLHRRVRCHSVSEVEAVTGISGQMIIAKLLHEESGGGILTTRGPYNSVFLQRSNAGFSIDQPISTTTMLLSGLTPLKVVTPRGQALVCLDARRGSSLRTISHQADSEEQYLVCECHKGRACSVLGNSFYS